MSLGSVRNALLSSIKKGIQGILVGPTQITTSTAATATAYSNQRKIDRTSNGVLWTVHNGGPGNFPSAYYSTDDGVSWVNAGGIVNGSQSSAWTYTPNHSLFIDQDDYAHFVFKDSSNGYIYYRRGTPNAGRTAWTWSAAYLISTTTSLNHPDLVAFRTPGSSPATWDVAVVVSRADSTTTDYVYYVRLRIDSNGAVTENSDGLTGHASMAILSSSYGVTIDKWPSIDFNHTGDGKTVAGGTPHLYVAWSAGATGAGKGIRFKKATYSGGSWTWGTEREIDNTGYDNANGNPWVNCIFDGVRVVIAGTLWTGSTYKIVLHERNALDTVTTTHVLDTGILYSGSATYDQDGNVWMVGRGGSGTNGNHPLYFLKWTRSSSSALVTTHNDTTTPDLTFVSAKRGYSNNRIEFIYTDGTASPYSVKYGGIK